MNSKGQAGEMLSIGYFIFLLIIVGATIFVMAKVVIGQSYDSRLTDASLLGNNIAACIDGRDLSRAEIENIEQTCDISLGDRMLILHIYIGNDKIYGHGDEVSCGLYELNNNNARCVESAARLRVDGEEADIRIVSGSNLVGGTKDEQ